MTGPTSASDGARRERARKPVGIARVRQPIKDTRSGSWRARYVDLDGAVRQLGLFKTKGTALAETTAIVADLNRNGPASNAAPTLLRFLDEWPRLFPRHPRTHATNRERIQRYIAPLLPENGDVPLDRIRRADLRDVQDTLLRRGLAKSTIDGAFSALSALMRDAVDIELIDANPAVGLRVRVGDPRLLPKRGPVKRRAIRPDEIAAFDQALDAKHRAVCWASLLTGCRPGELFAMQHSKFDAELQVIYLHQTVDRYGRLMDGLKGTHHLPAELDRGRWTLFPQPLVDLLPERDGDWLFPSPRGKLWAIRNFYRDVWAPAQREAGVAFTLYDLRHTFASRLIAGGIPVSEVSAWMGHSIRVGGQEIVNTTTRVYLHATGEWRQPALELLTGLYRAIAARRSSSP